MLTNPKDINAIAVLIEEIIVDPSNIAPFISRFLKRDVNMAFAKVTRGINRGAGYVLEIPCIYHLYGPRESLMKLNK